MNKILPILCLVIFLISCSNQNQSPHIENNKKIKKIISKIPENKILQSDQKISKNKKWNCHKNFSKKENDIFWLDKKIENVDVTSFECLNYQYSKDSKNVFFLYKILENADPVSFEILENKRFVRDKNSIFHIDKKIIDADLDSFETIYKDISKDKNSIFYKNEKITSADLQTFSQIKDYFFRDKNLVFYKNKIFEDADPITFEILNDYYFRDKNFAFFMDRENWGKFIKIKNVDALSFQILEKKLSPKNNFVFSEKEILNGENLNFFAHDKNSIFWKNKKIANVDAESFQILNFGYSKDKNNFFYRNNKIPVNKKIEQHEFVTDRDENLFFRGEKLTKIGNEYGGWKNEQYVFSYEMGSTFIILKNADPASFKPLGFEYSKDKNFVFWNGKILQNIDPKHFSVFTDKHYEFGKDKNSVFLHGKKINDADPATFSVVEEYKSYFRDKNFVFYDESNFLCLTFCSSEVGVKKINGADPASFEIIDEKFLKDKNHVFRIFDLNETFEPFAIKILKNADPETFESIIFKVNKTFFEARDKNYFFNGENFFKRTDFE